MKFEFDIPEQLAHLKVDDRGYPIPFFVRMIDRKPNFRFIDNDKLELCLVHKLCGICGKKLFKDYSYQITGPEGLKNQVSSEPMMHQVCARFALRVCPHLYFEKAERKETVGENAVALILDKPMELYLVKASKWKATHQQIISTAKVTGVEDRTRLRLIHYVPASFEKYIYQNNVLVLVPSGGDQDLK